MHVHALKAFTGVGFAALIVGGVAGISALHSSTTTREVTLTGGLGDGVALILGPGGSPSVPDAYMETVDQLYLEPLGFTGTTVAVTHDYADLFNSRIDLEVPALVDAVNAQMATGDVSAADPIVIVGYSESATAATLAMQQLYSEGTIPSYDLHFVLLGDSASDFGGFLNTFLSSLPESLQQPVEQLLDSPALGLTGLFPTPTPDDLYPTTVYALPGDGWGDWPSDASTDPTAEMQAIIGMFSTHFEYFGLTPTEIGDAVLTNQDGLVDYYTIPDADINPLTALWDALVNVVDAGALTQI
jgi:PE-PPE domain